MPRLPGRVVALVGAVVLGGCAGGTAGDAGPGEVTTSAAPTSISATTTSAAPPTTQAPVEATVVIRNAVVHRMVDGAGATATSVAIDGDRIVAVGDDDLVVSADAAVIDAGGAPVFPGFVDAHSHWYEYGIGDGLGPAEIAERILANGITTTAEFHVGPDLLAQLEAWERDEALLVRTSAYLVHTDVCGAEQGDWWLDHPATREPGEWLRIGGIKVFADGGACNVPAVSYTYADGTDGDLYRDAEALAAVIADIDAAGHQVAVHALGDRAVRTALDAYEQVLAGGENPRRHRIDHNAVVHPDDRARYDEVGVVAVVFGSWPTCAMVAGTAFEHRSPPELADWEWPWRSLLDANPDTVFAWHADAPFLDPSPGRTLEGLVTRAEGECQPTPGMAAGTITVDEALAMMTSGAAHALDRDTEVGTIEVGNFADLVLLSVDPTAVGPDELAGVEVRMTMVGGTPRWCRPGDEALCG